MTARTTSPFFTAAFGIACLTLAMITSPMAAVFFVERPITRMHWMVLAPVLAATVWRVRRSTDTTIVLSILSLTTRPTFVLRWPRAAVPSAVGWVMAIGYASFFVLLERLLRGARAGFFGILGVAGALVARTRPRPRS